ncbi:MAG TPA: cupin domain-containing protein [Solirubrobacteraceae bacterium]|nr:cupin domain-containing protein [Solirubrobacteraceae bacterium]
MPGASRTVDVATAELEAWPLEPAQVVAGAPAVSGLVLDSSPDGRVERGIWQHTPGVSRDVEGDELFVVVYGRATVAVGDGTVLELAPGVVGIFRAGERTVWTVHETLRKIYQTTG